MGRSKGTKGEAMLILFNRGLSFGESANPAPGVSTPIPEAVSAPVTSEFAGTVTTVITPDVEDLKEAIIVEDSSTGQFIAVPPEKVGVVIVGLSEYQNSTWNLRGPINDCHMFRTVVNNVYGVPVENVYTLYNVAATKRNVKNTLESAVKRHPYLILYWSGHGTQRYADDEPDYKEEVLVVYDHNWNDPLCDNEIRDILDRCKQAVVIADCCHAQGMSRGEFVIRSIVAPQKVRITNKRRTKALCRNVIELAACLSTECAFERPLGGEWHGEFTYHLCDILKNNPGIPLDVLQAQLRERIQNQNPVISPLSSSALFSAFKVSA